MINYLIENKEFTNLKGLIYFTDGCGLYPEKQPFRVISHLSA